MSTTTQDLVRFILGVGYDDFSRELVEIAKVCIVDSLGNMIGGSRERVSQIAIKYAKDGGGVAECGVIGGGFRSSLSNAVLINGASAHSLEIENGSADSYSVGFTLVPVALNVAEKFKLSGKAVLEGIILGWEFQSRLGLGTAEASKRGLNTLNLHGSLALAAAACRMMKLPADQTEMAIGLAAAQAGGLSETGSMCHLLGTGFAARNGVTAALLAKEGMTAQPGIIEGRRGFAELFCPVEGPKLDLITKNLGEPYYLASPGYYVKKYGCCWFTHGALDAVFLLIQEHNTQYDHIDSVQVEVHPHAERSVHFRDPQNGEQAKFSFQQALGAAIVDEKPDLPYLRPFSDAGSQNPKYREARKKINLVVRSDWANLDVHDSMPIVTIRLTDGRTYSKSVRALKGSPQMPLSKEELVARYRATVRGVLSSQPLQRSIDLVSDMENLPDVLELMELATFGYS